MEILIYGNSVFALYAVLQSLFVHFDKSLNLSPIFLEIHKEMRGGARLYHSAVYV